MEGEHAPPAPPSLKRPNRTAVGLADITPPTPPTNHPTEPFATPQTPTTSKLLNVSQMVRQQSDTTANRRLTRAAAICEDEPRPQTSANSNQMPEFLLQRPTKIVTVVDQRTNDKYIQLNQYRLMEEIGQGSYGIVKLAYNQEDHNLYAMKVLDKAKLLKNFACFRPPPARKNRATSAVHRDPLILINKEIAILKKLRHPNIVTLVEVVDDPSDKYLYMVFEYVERRTLLELPTEHPLDEETAWKYFRDTVKGLEYLHYQKIVHRDIKPQNLLLSEANQVKIADFGVSCEFEGIDAFLSGTAGTPAFMAPEALIEDSSQFYSGRAQDIWSLGITLYALVYGNTPFVDGYILALHKKIKNEPLVFLETPEITQPMKDLISRMLKKDPGLRANLNEIKNHPWVTKNGLWPMPSEEENCSLVSITEEDVQNAVRIIPRLDTLILVKAMGHRKRFGNPYRNSSASTTSLRLRRISSSVRDQSYNNDNSDVEMTDVNDQVDLNPDRPSSNQENDVADQMDTIRISSPLNQQ
ncbi:unnamed protein product [Bursaphelenchus okinawaensis]|uniref:calcium/calmodulin-dependent protein kinase n=1 Tax=Bursaphelenchus okinawaensis TaxID=465554 RepID=A0A811KFY5_9BILA|nr:unnamed protein product [Bursaphelenchus okinawaensis]CAG9101494.1 unnamed protein product [Bursaphelenchus okinawaensis]